MKDWVIQFNVQAYKVVITFKKLSTIDRKQSNIFKYTLISNLLFC